MAIASHRKTRARQPDSYMELVGKLPLRTLKNDREHHHAVDMIGSLMGRDLDIGASDYLDTLILIVNKYEDEHHTVSNADLTPQETLRAIMTANNLSQAAIGEIVGSESAISMFLSGKRALSKSHIKALAARFRIDASLLL